LNGERRASDNRGMAFSSVGIVGSGPVGCAIAIAVARTDTPVLLVRTTPGDVSLATRRIESRLRYFLDATEMTEEEVVRARGGIRVVPDLAMLSACDLVIESVSGDDRARRAVLATLESRLSPGAVLATNSPIEHLSAIAEVLRRRDQFVGLSFFSGAAADPPPRRGARPSLPSKRLVELGLLAETAPGVAAACKAFALSLGTTTIERATGVALVGYREFLSGDASSPAAP
jgi:3-hydroxyacyl-CoA dehydrogenase